ncbi:MAG: hypothetical protein ACRDLR_00315, partial [Gaiellaceae bacterium]
VQDLELLYVSATAHNPQQAAAVANAAPVALRAFIKESDTPGDQIVTINPAGVPTTPTSPHPTRVAILALIVGLVVNGALALLMEFLADRLPDVDELEASLGKPVLATVPKVVLAPGVVEDLKRVPTGRSATPSSRAAHGLGTGRRDPRIG